MNVCQLLFAAVLLIAPLLSAQDTLYNNGADPGNIYGLAISDGFELANSFALGIHSTITAIDVSLYDVNAYNLPLSLDWKIFDRPNGHVLASGVQSKLRKVEGPDVNYFLFNQWLMEFEITPSLQLRPGTYWLVLSNATNTWNTSTFWGECDGPSKVISVNLGNGRWKHGGRFENGSESFQVLGYPTGAPGLRSIQ